MSTATVKNIEVSKNGVQRGAAKTSYNIKITRFFAAKLGRSWFITSHSHVIFWVKQKLNTFVATADQLLIFAWCVFTAYKTFAGIAVGLAFIKKSFGFFKRFMGVRTANIGSIYLRHTRAKENSRISPYKRFCVLTLKDQNSKVINAKRLVKYLLVAGMVAHHFVSSFFMFRFGKGNQPKHQSRCQMPVVHTPPCVSSNNFVFSGGLGSPA